MLLVSAPASAQPVSAEGPYPFPAIRFAAVETFLDAIDVDKEAALTAEAYWQPAIDALVAANPRKAKEARAFAEARRSAEASQYRPIVAVSLDHDALELLYPEGARALEALYAKDGVGSGAAGSLSQEQRQEFARETVRVRVEQARRVNADLIALAALARTADGAALRDLFRRNYWWCAQKRRAAWREAECTQLERSGALRRLKQTPEGEKLILVNTAAYGQLMALMEMAHDSGISLHGLLPPEQVRAAGLAVPEDLPEDELIARHVRFREGRR